MKAIIKRELKSYFTSVLGWIFLAAFLFVFNLYFWVYNINFGYPYISYALSGSTFIFLIIIPILSMRSMAEDRKNKTDQLLYTAPISIPRVILGKYLAMAIIFSIAMGWACLCPLIMKCFGTVPFGESYTAILGIWLFGLLCLAIGIFLSSVTESQVIAAVLSFAVLFLGYMMDSIISAVTASENIMTKSLGCLAIASPLDDFTSGV
ncbi:MAG: ABC transporter permease, partial [Clostridiales bacterium]|nr:ABC transporter permease [Clostridiales bacterium]